MATERTMDDNVKAVNKNVRDNSAHAHYDAGDSKALVTVTQHEDKATRNLGFDDESPRGSKASLAISPLRGSISRDLILAKLHQERTLCLIRAWEESVKAKSMNRYNMKVSKISAWESGKKAAAEARLKQLEAKLEQQRAAYEKAMKNKIASVHKKAEEQRAVVKARHGEEIITVEETAAKFRASRKIPKRWPHCLWM